MNNKMVLNISYPFGTTFIDYPDNESVAVIVYFMGCEQNCFGCQNPSFRDPDNKDNTVKASAQDILKEIKLFCKRNQTNKIVFSGGDPLHPNNINGVQYLLDNLENEYSIIIYTSYEINFIKEKGVTGPDYYKCGIFNRNLYQVPEKTDKYLRFASSNQNLYNKKLELISNNGVLILE